MHNYSTCKIWILLEMCGSHGHWHIPYTILECAVIMTEYSDSKLTQGYDCRNIHTSNWVKRNISRIVVDLSDSIYFKCYFVISNFHKINVFTK